HRLIERSRQRLQERLTRAGFPPLRFASVMSPVGTIYLSTSDIGVCDLSWRVASDSEYRARLQHRAPEVQRDDKGVRPILMELRAYFEGDLKAFTVPVDLRGVSTFTASVLEAARKIPYGRVSSYGGIANRIGAPRAARAVGGALGRNPVAIIVPCHRVLASGGNLGGYTGGIGIKERLLQLEGYCLPRQPNS
ncbi:MAG: methylated-DNA--[protein]-cysteine S-methyltransferase, partial [Acidimicrobiia bacterium]